MEVCGCGGCDVGPELGELLSCTVPSGAEAQLQINTTPLLGNSLQHSTTLTAYRSLGKLQTFLNYDTLHLVQPAMQL